MASDDHLGSLLPRMFQVVPNQIFIQLLMVDWLLQEVDAPPAIASKVNKLSGWRRAEVIDYIASHDWTASMFAGMNGPGAVV